MPAGHQKEKEESRIPNLNLTTELDSVLILSEVDQKWTETLSYLTE
jgi:hypothetical protein